MKLHVVAFPFSETTAHFEMEAFTAGIRKFSTMMTSIGYDVRLYAGEENEAQCTEHIPIVSREEQKKWYGHIDFLRDSFNEWDSRTEPWQTMNARAAEQIRKRAEPGDALCLFMGGTQFPVANALEGLGLFAIEASIGYPGTWAPFRVFTSYTARHFHSDRPPKDIFRRFDAVIPNSFEIDAFPDGKGDGDYFLYLGRVVSTKGPQIAAETCKRLGARLIIAGQCVMNVDPLTTMDGVVLDGDVEYVGTVDPIRRAQLLGGAKAVFAPTIIVEHFGNAVVEGMMCGTPAITTDWGAFTETVIDGVTGFRCNTLSEFVDAAKRVGELDRKAIRKYAQGRFSTDVVRYQYDRYFQRLAKDFPLFEIEKKQQEEDATKSLADAARRHQSPDETLNVSLRHFEAGRFEECITAAKMAIEFRPDFGAAWVNICCANNAMGYFEAGRSAGEEAVRILPDSQLAKNNLNWSLDGLRQQQQMAV